MAIKGINLLWDATTQGHLDTFTAARVAELVTEETKVGGIVDQLEAIYGDTTTDSNGVAYPAGTAYSAKHISSVINEDTTVNYLGIQKEFPFNRKYMRDIMNMREDSSRYSNDHTGIIEADTRLDAATAVYQTLMGSQFNGAAVYGDPVLMGENQA